MSTELDPGFEELLDFVHEARGFDYSQYKRPSLMRRFEKRMQTAGVDTYEDYRSYLEAEPREFAELLDTILINVTGFFRDPARGSTSPRRSSRRSSSRSPTARGSARGRPAARREKRRTRSPCSSPRH